MSISTEKRSIMLDVDSSIIEKNVTIVKDWSLEDDLKSILPNTNPASLNVRPHPGFCIKTKISNEDRKAFVNICHTDSIPPPDDISSDELIEILQSDEPSSYRVPMSIGEPRVDNDKSGQPASVYDVAIGTKFFKKIDSNDLFRTFFINVVFEGLQNKFQIELDIDEHVILKNRKSVGSLQMHRIQKRIAENVDGAANKPLIEELTAKSYKKLVNSNKSEKKKEPAALEYVIKRTPMHGKLQYLIVECKIPLHTKCNDILVDLGEDRVIVEINKTKYMMDIFVPYNIKQDTAKAVYDKSANMLTIKVEAEESQN